MIYGWQLRRAGAAIAVALAGLMLTVGVARAAQPLGTLTQLPGTAGCFTFNGASEDGAGTCSQARGLAEGGSAAVSPDGANVYVGSYASSVQTGFAVFARDRSTGGLTQLAGTAGCLTSDGSSSAGPGTCTKARGLVSSTGDGHDIAFTSDGRWAYLVAQNNAPSQPGAIMIFQRDPSTGALAQLAGTAGCITSDGSSQDGAGTCQTDSTLLSVSGISISSDDHFLYVTGDGFGQHRLHVLARNTTTGALAEVQCLSEAPAPAGCQTGRVLGNQQYLALSPDGLHAYGTEYSKGLSIFDRNPSTGLLTQKAGTAGCITDDGLDDTGASTCSVGRVVDGSYPLLIGPNGQTLYDPAGGDSGFSVFHINSDGTLTQLSGSAGCTTINGKDNNGASTCTTARDVDNLYGGVISPDGASMYVSDQSSAGGVAIFALNPTTGVATQMPGLAGCITSDGSSDGTAGECTDGRALGGGYGMTISPDGHSVYQATQNTGSAGLAIFSRETAPVCQATAAATAVNNPVTVTLNCPDADGDAVTRAVSSGPSHGTLSAINNAAGTVTYSPAHRFKGTDAFTFNATDGVNASAPVTATITVGVATLSKLRISPSKASFAGRKVKGRCVKPTKKNNGNKHCRRAIELRVSYTLSAAATVKFTVQRVTTGRKVNRKCVKQTKKNKKHAKCTRLVSVRGSITRTTGARARAFTFTGKIGGKNLPAGTYRLVATPTGGTPKTVTFKITG